MSLPSPLLAVTDRHGHARPLAETVGAVLAGGGRWIWFRDKDLPARERRALGEAVADAVRAAGGILTIGGDPDLAVALGAGGAHLSAGAPVAAARDRLGGGLLGVSAHSLREVEAAALSGADYVTLSPIFPTASKPGYGPALGPEAITAARGFGIPVVALGGIGEGTLMACRKAGAAGFAVMGGVMRGDDPEGATRDLLTGWADCRLGSTEPSPISLPPLRGGWPPT